MALQLDQFEFRVSLQVFEAVIHSVQDLLRKPNCCHLEFCLLLRTAKHRLESLDTHVRTHLRTLIRRIPTVLLLSIVQFLSPFDRRQTLAVCKSWSTLTLSQISPSSPPSCPMALHGAPHGAPHQSYEGEASNDQWVLCRTCKKVVCQPCSVEEHDEEHVFCSLEKGAEIVKGYLKEVGQRIDGDLDKKGNLEREDVQQLTHLRKSFEDIIKQREQIRQQRAQKLEDAANIKDLLTRSKMNPFQFLQRAIPYVAKTPWFVRGEPLGPMVVGHLLDVRDTIGEWCGATILAVKETSVYVHYHFWSSDWDEWLDLESGRLALFRTVARLRTC